MVGGTGVRGHVDSVGDVEGGKVRGELRAYWVAVSVVVLSIAINYTR
jgi:hypothetical protein